MTSSSLVNNHSPSPLSQTSFKLPQSSPSSVTSQLPVTTATTSFIRPFEDNYTSFSPAKSKSSFLSSLSDTTLRCGSQSTSTTFTPLSTSKLSNPFECFSTMKTPDSGLVDPPSAHLSSQTASSYMSVTTPLELSSFPSVSSSSASNSPSFKPFSSYPYDLIQFPPFKNHMIGHLSLSPPLSKKLRPQTSATSGDGVCISELGGGRLSKSNRTTNSKPRIKNAKSAEKKKTLSTSSSDANVIPLNLSTTSSLMTNDNVEKTQNVINASKESNLCDTINRSENIDEATAAVTAAAQQTSTTFAAAVVAEVNSYNKLSHE